MAISSPINGGVEETWNYIQSELSLRGEFKDAWHELRPTSSECVQSDLREGAISLVSTDLLAVWAILGATLVLASVTGHLCDARPRKRTVQFSPEPVLVNVGQTFAVVSPTGARASFSIVPSFSADSFESREEVELTDMQPQRGEQ